MIFARKIDKIPDVYIIFARKIPEFYILIARKLFFPIYLGGGWTPPPLPVSYAYAVVVARRRSFASLIVFNPCRLNAMHL